MAAAAHSWVKFKLPAKNEIQKIRENDGSYLFLQRFDNFFICNDRKRKLFEYAGICMEKLVKSHCVNLFFGGF
jgi:hypothetical protein